MQGVNDSDKSNCNSAHVYDLSRLISDFGNRKIEHHQHCEPS